MISQRLPLEHRTYMSIICGTKFKLSKSIKSSLALTVLAFSFAQVSAANAFAVKETKQTAVPANDEIEFSSNTLEYDFENDIVAANGDVKLSREGYTLYADKVVWNRKTGVVTASGNVRTVSAEGDVAYGESIVLTDTLRDGVVENLLLVLDDGSRLAAKKGERFSDGTFLLDNAAYTACAVTTEDGCPKNPSWQIKAVKVIYDPIKKRVSYKGARIEIFGLPVVPLPGLSHPVSNENRSGVLVPNIKFNSVNGASVVVPYYFNIAPNEDATVKAHVFTGVAPMVSGNYRFLDENGAF